MGYERSRLGRCTSQVSPAVHARSSCSSHLLTLVPVHSPDPKQNAVQDAEWTLWRLRGWVNFIALFGILGTLITRFAGYPIIAYYQRIELEANGYNLGGINVTGQVPFLPNLPTRIDTDTPQDVYTRTGFDGNSYTLGTWIS
jgi:beta-glucan synthesis-associated protein KRE6